MAEELKAKMRKLENLIGCQKMDATSKCSTEKFIEALNSKYKSDVKNSLHLHRLEFYHALIEDARQKKRKSVEVEENFLVAKEDEDTKKEVDKTPIVKNMDELEKPDEVVSVPPEDIDEWKNLMTLSKIYYVLEHPMSEGLTWKRRVRKKKHISKFNDKDLIEWRVAQNFRLKTLEEWALSRSEARKLAEESPYDFDDLLDDDESRELEDMFNILGTQRQNKRDVGVLEKALHTKRPFKFKDEVMEDWTESYSDDSEVSGAEQGFYEILEIEDEPDLKVEDYKESSSEPSLDEGQDVPEIFSSYKDIPKYKRPIFEAMEETEDMKDWYDLCHEAIGEGKELSFKPMVSPPKITIASPEDGKKSMTEVEREYETQGKEPLATIHEKDEEGHKRSALDEDTIRRKATKSDIELIIETAKSELQDKERSSVKISKEQDVDLDLVLRKESTSKRRMNKIEDDKDIEPKSKVSISEDHASAVKSGLKSMISAARSSASEIVQAGAGKPPKEAESSVEPDENLDSVLRKESTSKSRIDKEGKESSSTVSHESIVKNKVKSLTSTAKGLALDLKTAEPSEDAELAGEETADLESVLTKESLSKSRINKNKENVVKEPTYDGTVHKDHEKEVKNEIESLVFKAKNSTENLFQEASKPLEETGSIGEQDENLDSVLRKESTSKSRINKKDEMNVKETTPDGTTNKDHESAAKNENKFLITEAKSSTENLAQEDTKPMDETEPLREQHDNLDSALRKESTSKSKINKKEEKDVKETTSDGTTNKDNESAAKNEINSLISYGKSSTENLAQEDTKPMDETEPLKEQDYNLDSVLRKESTSKSKINKNEEKDVKESTPDGTTNKDHESAAKNENKFLITEAKSSTENLAQEDTKPMDETEPLREQHDNLDSALRKESTSKSRIAKNEK